MNQVAFDCYKWWLSRKASGKLPLSKGSLRVDSVCDLPHLFIHWPTSSKLLSYHNQIWKSYFTKNILLLINFQLSLSSIELSKREPCIPGSPRARAPNHSSKPQSQSQPINSTMQRSLPMGMPALEPWEPQSPKS